ncbi:MAG: DUF1553 domain-containing protein, partial [Verrucomicrobia bacterium]|nr:DUF1553 domain-containing protein [Verrucomicrobiota bacterium]
RFTWHSITSGLHRHIGRPAYFELIDNGDGYIALDRILFSSDAKPPADEPGIDSPPGASAQELAQGIENAVHHALDGWLRPAAQSGDLGLASWLAMKGLLDWGASGQEVTNLIGRMTRSAEGLPRPMRVLAMTDGSPEPTRVFLRGDHRTPGVAVHRGVPKAVSRATTSSLGGEGSGRLELAGALLSESNPLGYRVIVNRVWAHLFGRGLVATVDDFGTMGAAPTHPELLDYLARTFRTEGGSIKKLIRSLCLTRTFAMSSVSTDPAAQARDPDNSLLHRMRLRRLEGEIIRDSLIAVAGQLNRKQFGPSVPTYFTPFMGDRMWVSNPSGPMDGDRRRTVYLETRRNFLSTWMLTFDLPLPDSTVGRRNQSNVPGQALALMNDPLVQQQADAWATNNLKRTSFTDRERIEDLFLRALSRRPRSTELDQMLAFLADQAAARGLSPEVAALNPEVWADACHVVFMMKEFTHVP